MTSFWHFVCFQEYFDENTKSYFFFCCEGYRDKSKSLTVIMCIICMMSISGAHPGHRDPWDECTCKTWCKLFTFFMLKSQTQPTLTVLCLHTVALLFYFFSTYFCSPVLLTVKMYVSPHWLTTSCSDTVKCTSSLGTPLLFFNDS